MNFYGKRQSSTTSNQNFSFEKELLQRISNSQLISTLIIAISIIIRHLSFTSLQPTSPFLSENILGRRDQLLRTIYDRLSWSDIGDYFSNLINEMGLGMNVSNVSNSNSSVSNPIYSEPNLANQFVYYNTMFRIPGEGTEGTNLSRRKKIKKR